MLSVHGCNRGIGFKKKNYKILYIKQEIFICNICYMQWILFTTILKYIFTFCCCSWESFGFLFFVFEINNQQATKQQGAQTTAQTEIPENCMKLCNSIIIYFIKKLNFIIDFVSVFSVLSDFSGVHENCSQNFQFLSLLCPNHYQNKVTNTHTLEKSLIMSRLECFKYRSTIIKHRLSSVESWNVMLTYEFYQ